MITSISTMENTHNAIRYSNGVKGKVCCIDDTGKWEHVIFEDGGELMIPIEEAQN